MTHSGLHDAHSKVPISMRSMLVLGSLLLLSLPLAAEIYRCDIDGVIVFSDRPCQASAEPYQTGRSLSISGSAEDLAETAARNQAWLESEAQRREQRRAALAARPAPAMPDPPPPARAVIGPGFGSWGVPYLQPDPGQRQRQAAQRGPTERGPRHRAAADETETNPRYSALSGRQPGARRDP